MDDGSWDDAARLRQARADSDDAATRQSGATGGGAACLVGKVLTASGPAAPGFFSLQAQDVTGAEAEGGAGTLTTSGFNFVALNVGTVVPPAGTYVLCTSLSYRWVFRYDG